MEKWIEEAKARVEKHYSGGPDPKRQWLMATPPDSYDDPSNRVEIYVWTGSPPKGYVLASYGAQFVLALGYSGKRLGTWKVV